MRHTSTAVTVVTLLSCLASAPAYSSGGSAASDNSPVDIARIKAAHYRALGFELLPEFISDSTIGPGRFAAMDDVVIGGGATLSLLPGTAIMFEPQKRFVVEGTLLAASTDRGRIMLTNMPLDMRYVKVAVADSLWNGILIEAGGQLLVNRIAIANATAGITVSGVIEGNDISCVDMAENVPVPVAVSGTPRFVADPACVVLSDFTSTAPVSGSTVESSARPRNPVIALRVGLCVFTAGGIAATAYGIREYRKWGLLYEQSTDPSRHTPHTVDDYRTRALRGRNIALAGAVAGILGASGVTLTFLF